MFLRLFAGFLRIEQMVRKVIQNYKLIEKNHRLNISAETKFLFSILSSLHHDGGNSKKTLLTM